MICVCSRFVGPYLKLCPEHVFVVEDGDGLCGFAVAASDSKHFYEQFKKHWLPEVHVYVYIYIYILFCRVSSEELAYKYKHRFWCFFFNNNH